MSFSFSYNAMTDIGTSLSSSRLQINCTLDNSQWRVQVIHSIFLLPSGDPAGDMNVNRERLVYVTQINGPNSVCTVWNGDDSFF